MVSEEPMLRRAYVDWRQVLPADCTDSIELDRERVVMGRQR